MSARGSEEIVLGTRGSELALIQARTVEQTLMEKCGLHVRIEIICTSGDEPAGAAGRKGMFTAELERALSDGRIDLAVHSAKDLPSEMPAELAIAAVLPRAAVEDVVLTKTGTPFAALPHGASIATGSVRRQRQARWSRPDLQVHDLRGNVPTRLRKLIASDWSAIILARAGLERLGYFAPQFIFEGAQIFAEILPAEIFVPAGGQGMVALQMRRDEAPKVAAADDAHTHQCLRAERALLRLLEGDCNTPVGAHARVTGSGEIALSVQLFGDPAAPRMSSASGHDPEKLAALVYEKVTS